MYSDDGCMYDRFYVPSYVVVSQTRRNILKSCFPFPVLKPQIPVTPAFDPSSLFFFQRRGVPAGRRFKNYITHQTWNPNLQLSLKTNLVRSLEKEGEAKEEEEVCSMAKNMSKPSKLGVYLYIPNIIGYIRVVMNCYAFAICFSNKRLFCALYFISFVCDGIDGWCARKFNQVSTFGAVLDMVTDRISTACLLLILSQIYQPGLTFVSLLALDIASHWLQMYSTFLLGKASHKDVKDSTNWLFKAYYGNRMFMAYCCVACEVLYIMLFLLAEKQPENLKDILVTSVKEGSLVSILIGLSLFGWAIKQVVNVIQMKTAADVCVLYDINKRERP